MAPEIDSDAIGMVESAPRDGADVSSGNFSNSVVVGIRNVNITRGVHCNIHWIVQFRLRRSGAIARVSERVVAGNRGNGSVRNLAYDIVARSGDVQIAGGVHRHAYRIVQLSAGGCAIVPCVARSALGGHRRKGSTGEVADAMVASIGDVEGAGRVDCDASWQF